MSDLGQDELQQQRTTLAHQNWTIVDRKLTLGKRTWMRYVEVHLIVDFLSAFSQVDGLLSVRMLQVAVCIP